MPINRHMTVMPVTLRAANAFILQHHRHNGAVRGHLFALQAVNAEGWCCGVVIVGRPIARHLQDGQTCEITRLCTDGTPHACSLLYGRARRVAQVMGYQRILTYTLSSEPGTSLIAAGFRDDGFAGGGSWDRPGRARRDKAPLESKRRWIA